LYLFYQPPSPSQSESIIKKVGIILDKNHFVMDKSGIDERGAIRTVYMVAKRQSTT
jgi:hypothetical protein